MEIIAVFVLIMVVLVAVMIYMTPRRRVIGFVLGLIVFWDGVMLAQFEAPGLALLALAGAMIALAALLVEVPAFVIRTVRRYLR